MRCAYHVQIMPIVLDRMSYVLLFACVIGLQRYDNDIYKVLAACRLFLNTNKKIKGLKIKNEKSNGGAEDRTQYLVKSYCIRQCK